MQALLPAEDADTKKRSVVQRTWSAMEKLQAQFLTMFFKMLFETNQRIALRFESSNMEVIKEKLASTITNVMAKLDDKDALKEYVDVVERRNFVLTCIICFLF
jgi:hypothetical protein